MQLLPGEQLGPIYVALSHKLHTTLDLNEMHADEAVSRHLSVACPQLPHHQSALMWVNAYFWRTATGNREDGHDCLHDWPGLQESEASCDG